MVVSFAYGVRFCSHNQKEKELNGKVPFETQRILTEWTHQKSSCTKASSSAHDDASCAAGWKAAGMCSYLTDCVNVAVSVWTLARDVSFLRGGNILVWNDQSNSNQHVCPKKLFISSLSYTSFIYYNTIYPTASLKYKAWFSPKFHTQQPKIIRDTSLRSAWQGRVLFGECLNIYQCFPWYHSQIIIKG